MKFLLAASLLVSASAFSLGPSANTQGASSTVSKRKYDVLPMNMNYSITFNFDYSFVLFSHFLKYENSNSINFVVRLFSLKKMVQSYLFESVPEDLLWPWHKPSKLEDAFKSNSKK